MMLLDWAAVMRIERVQNWAQHAPLRRASAERGGGGEMGTELNSLRVVSQEVPDPSAGEWGEAQICEFAEEDDGVEGWALIDKNHPHIALLMFQMAQRIVESYDYCILSRSVSSVGKLMIVEGGGEAGFQVV